MLKISGIRLPVGYSADELTGAVQDMLRIPRADIHSIRLLRRSLDARHGGAFYQCSVLVSVSNEQQLCAALPGQAELYTENLYRFPYAGMPPCSRRPVIVGSGPSGLFCALMLARCGQKPVVLERGVDVDRRAADVSRFWQSGTLDPESNVQFGEGGAGTFSDGKLTCGKNDARIPFVLRELIRAGAPDEIEYSNKPHIGTDRLRQVVKTIRAEICALGGEFLFQTKLIDIRQEKGHVRGIVILQYGSERELAVDTLVLAIGHSARDTFRMLHQNKFAMIAKPFSVGVRIEHPREWIDRIQYRGAYDRGCLPAADYKLAYHTKDGRGVYSFCMCPGGQVVASSSETGGVVTNGMSNYSRDAENSNSALLVGVGPDDFGNAPLDGIRFQERWERAAFALGGGGYAAPAQLVGDFLEGAVSSGAKTVRPSYRPGVLFTDLTQCLPHFATDALREALPAFDRKMRGFCLPDAVLTGVETRSSSPVRILRDDDMQASIRGVYPCGEGAGYAGGIMSCAVDGIKCAEHILKRLVEKADA